MGNRSVKVVRPGQGAGFYLFGDTYRFLETGKGTAGDYFEAGENADLFCSRRN
jgi:hypothetical protein